MIYAGAAVKKIQKCHLAFDEKLEQLKQQGKKFQPIK